MSRESRKGDNRKTGRAPEPALRKPFAVLVASRPTGHALGGRSGVLSFGVHTALIVSAIWATMSSGQEPTGTSAITVVDMTQDVPLPPPPPPPPPIENAPPPSPDVVFGFRTLEIPTIIPPELPPPGPPVDPRDYIGIGREGGSANGTVVSDSAFIDRLARTDDPSTPSFTPMTVKPEILNRDDVRKALEREYPAVLRDSNIGGTVMLWVQVDTDGRVEQTQINRSSGQPLLDKAAENVGRVMRFSPAFNYDQKVMVWVAIPVTFQTGGEVGNSVHH